MNGIPQILNAWITGLGGRRFTITIGAGLVSTLLFVCHILSESGFITLVLGTVGAYITGNTVEAVKSNAKPSP